jgi:hypothetical protein
MPAAPQTMGCVIDPARNGEVVRIRGEVFPTAHDAFIRPKGCPDIRVILMYGDDQSLGKAKLSMTRDEAFRRFKKYSGEEQRQKANEICMHCPRYRVSADFVGRLDIAISVGWKKDPNLKISQSSGKKLATVA